MNIGFTIDPFGTVKEAINSLQPTKSKHEKEYIKSLADELQKKLKNQKILTEYGSGRQRIDIVVDGKVPIELKKDLKGTSELHRVIGQLHQYNKNWKGIFLVLCSDTTDDVNKDLEKLAKDKEDITDILGEDIKRDEKHGKKNSG